VLTPVYHGQAEVKVSKSLTTTAGSDSQMWVFSKNTIAGDLGVTPIVQCLASMLITSTLVHTDIHNRAIQPLPFVYPHVEHLPDPRTFFRKRKTELSPEEKSDEAEAPRGWFMYHYLMLVRFIFEGTEKNMMLARIPVSSWFGRLAWTAAQGAAIGVIFGFPIWCLAIVILGPIYQNENMGDKWAPQVIKLVYGAIVGWVTNPVIAVLALGSQAESHLEVIEHDVEHQAAEGVPTILEDEEFIALPAERSALGASPALSPARRLSGTLMPQTPTLTVRSRSGSNTSRMSRPPLTANVSHISPLPTTSPLPPSPSPNASTRLRADSVGAVRLARPRGATVSSYASNRSFSYALGGTGGRAQRPRAASRASASGVPALVLPTGDSTRLGAGNTLSAPDHSPRPDERPVVWDVFGKQQSVAQLGGSTGKTSVDEV